LTHMGMKQKPVWRVSLSFFFALFGYWLLPSLVDRAAFAWTFAYKIGEPKDIAFAFLFGLRLDISLAAYLLVLPFLFFTVQHRVLRRAVSPPLLRGYVRLPTLRFAAITITNVPLDAAWGEKISKRAIVLGLDTIGGVSSSIDIGMLWQAFF